MDNGFNLSVQQIFPDWEKILGGEAVWVRYFILKQEIKRAALALVQCDKTVSV